MEIALVSKSSLRIKGKEASLVIDPSDKSEANAALLLDRDSKVSSQAQVDIVINGPGEYETGGIKITGIKQEANVIYNLAVDAVGVLLGKISSLEKVHTKLKEANILIVNCDSVIDPSFLTALFTNVIIFYGEKSTEVGNSFAKENTKRASKYATTFDKLPAEAETVILE